MKMPSKPDGQDKRSISIPSLLNPTPDSNFSPLNSLIRRAHPPGAVSNLPAFGHPPGQDPRPNRFFPQLERGRRYEMGGYGSAPVDYHTPPNRIFPPDTAPASCLILVRQFVEAHCMFRGWWSSAGSMARPSSALAGNAEEGNYARTANHWSPSGASVNVNSPLVEENHDYIRTMSEAHAPIYPDRIPGRGPYSTRNPRDDHITITPNPSQHRYPPTSTNPLNTSNRRPADFTQVKRCYSCGTIQTVLWRRSKVHLGKHLCNRCGLWERSNRAAPAEGRVKFIVQSPYTSAGHYLNSDGTNM
ncbi:hypothetical protein D9757_001414 [Collybiopsis confluens]|uniref:GATA-type domain-containing protein n=1 Tax=Collybiopsis confluens TaxID=2823264 RepID=A0A8H5MFR6_9AGAR|nr:hypothetical protein D9757_001414 [Collybiopsis confluens]